MRITPRASMGASDAPSLSSVLVTFLSSVRLIAMFRACSSNCWNSGIFSSGSVLAIACSRSLGAFPRRVDMGLRFSAASTPAISGAHWFIRSFFFSRMRPSSRPNLPM